MNRDYPLSPSPNMADRVEISPNKQKRIDKLESKVHRLADEGKVKRGERVLVRAGLIEDRAIERAAKKKK